MESMPQIASWTASKNTCSFGFYTKDASSWLLLIKTKANVHIVLHCFQQPKNQKQHRTIFMQRRGRTVPAYVSKPEDRSRNTENKQRPWNEADSKRPDPGDSQGKNNHLQQ